MTPFRLVAAFLISTLLTSCQTAGALMNEPMNLLNDVFSTVGRTVHASNDRKPGDSSIEAAEAEKAQLALRGDQSAAPAEAPAAAVAAR